MRSLAFLVTVVVVVVVVDGGACGRSAPNQGACPAYEGLVCDELLNVEKAQTGAYAAAVANVDAKSAAAAGACNETAVDLELQRKCFADPCVELCALQPCGIHGDASCVDKCGTLVKANAKLAAALDRVVVRAARAPGLCACNECANDDGTADADTAPICVDLFVCTAPAGNNDVDAGPSG